MKYKLVYEVYYNTFHVVLRAVAAVHICRITD